MPLLRKTGMASLCRQGLCSAIGAPFASWVIAIAHRRHGTSSSPSSTPTTAAAAAAATKRGDRRRKTKGDQQTAAATTSAAAVKSPIDWGAAAMDFESLPPPSLPSDQLLAPSSLPTTALATACKRRKKKDVVDITVTASAAAVKSPIDWGSAAMELEALPSAPSTPSDPTATSSTPPLPSANRVCRPALVPMLMPPLLASHQQAELLLTNEYILSRIAQALPFLTTKMASAGNTCRETANDTQTEEGKEGVPSAIEWGSGDVFGLDASVDLAAWALAHPSVSPLSPSYTLPSACTRPPRNARAGVGGSPSGSVSFAHAQLEGIHKALSHHCSLHYNDARTSVVRMNDNTNNAAVPFIIGCDEAGRGPLAGPVVSGAYGRLLLKKTHRGEGKLRLATMDDYRRLLHSNNGCGGGLVTSFPEVIPALDSKQLSTSGRLYAFYEGIAKGSAAAKALGQLTGRTTTLLNRPLESVGPLTSDEVRLYTVTNPAPPVDLSANTVPSPAGPQHMVLVEGEERARIDASSSAAINGDAVGNADGATNDSRAFSIAKLLDCVASGHNALPPLIAAASFSNLVRVPFNAEGSLNASATTSSSHHAQAATIGAARAAVRDYLAAVKAGQKAVASEAKRLARARIREAKAAEKLAAKLAKQAAKGSKDKSVSSAPDADSAVASASTVGSMPPSTSSPSHLPTARDWEPAGLHPTLRAVWEANQALYPNANPTDGAATAGGCDGDGANGEEGGRAEYYYLQLGATAIADHRYIDATNILAASMHSMSAAVRGVLSEVGMYLASNNGESHSCCDHSVSLDGLGPAVLLVDGSGVPADLSSLMEDGATADDHNGNGVRIKAMIPITKGDGTSYAIGAASAIAKTTREEVMGYYGRGSNTATADGASAGGCRGSAFPQYGFAQHEGYPCAVHREAIRQHGLSPIHRLTYGPCREAAMRGQTHSSDDDKKGRQ